MNDVIALVGNPNSGKTTLFNTLTGTYQKVGNWSGVTVEKKTGLYKKNKAIKIIDLPGIYSFTPNSEDEKVVYEYFKKTPPKAIINIVDGTNLERNLSLTLSLLALKIPIVVAVNMADDLEKNGIELLENKLAGFLGVPVIKISALKNTGIDQLMNTVQNLKSSVNRHEIIKANGIDSEEKKYSYIRKILPYVINKKQTKSERFTFYADKLLMHKIWGLPIFILVIICIYFLSIKIGGFFGGYVSTFFNDLSVFVWEKLLALDTKDFIISLVCNAIIKGVGTVMSFLPQILVLFFLLCILEESGYMARAGFITDRIFRLTGLCGKSVIPLIVSCGCTVTGLMATRTIEDRSSRETTIFISPFMPCGAKTAVFGWFSTVFFGGNALIATSTYFLAIIVCGISGAILEKFKNIKDGTFIIEIPTLRFPSVKDIFYVLWAKTKEFLIKAGTVIFTISIVIWLLKSFGVSGYVGEQIEKSFLYFLGDALKWFFYPLGFSSWQTSVAILTGTLAKEAVIETLAITGVDFSQLFSNGFQAYSFMAFVLLSPPCVASQITAYRELKNVKKFLLMIAFQTAVAFGVSLIINLAGILLLSVTGLILIIVLGIIVTIFLIIKMHKVKGNKKCQINIKRNTTI